MPTPDCDYCERAALLAKNFENLCTLLEELLALLIKKNEIETRFWKRMLTELERKR